MLKERLTASLQGLYQRGLDAWSIAGWPPLASHLVFLLMGAASANLFMPAATGGPRLPKGKLLFSLPATGRYTASQVEAGERLWPVKYDESGTPCRLSASPFLLLSSESSVLLSLEFKEARGLAAVLDEEKAGRLRLLTEHAALSLTGCQGKRTVRYGSRT
jgi:hypothetical protein